MRRIVLALAVVGMLAFGAAQAQAQHGWGHHGGHHRSHYHHYYGPPRHYVPYYGPAIAYPAPVMPYYPPAYVVPVPVYPRPHYYPPASGFFYRGSGVSIGIGF